MTDDKDKISPSYYQKGGLDLAKVIHAFELSYIVGNIWKYTARYEEKNGMEDLEKAEKYLQMLKEVSKK